MGGNTDSKSDAAPQRGWRVGVPPRCRPDGELDGHNPLNLWLSANSRPAPVLVKRNGTGTSAGLADLKDDGAGFALTRAVMDEKLGAHRARAIALARPIPREAPVTRAVFFGKTANDRVFF